MNAFGLEFIDLPGAWPDSEGPVRASVRWRLDDHGFTPSPRWWFRDFDDGLIVHFEDVAEYHLRKGSAADVSVTLGPATEFGAALAFLVSVIPLGLPLFELEPFHGAALETADGSALLVLGPAEAGKSTTASALRASGLRFLADDACALDDGGRLWPGPPLFGIHELGPSDVEFAAYDDKSIVAVIDHDPSPREVWGAVILQPERRAALAVAPIPRREAVTAVLGQVRAPRVMPSLRDERQFRMAVALAARPLAMVSFDKDRHGPEHVAQAIVGWLEAA